ncbi:MAG: AAA family ATPase, partial [Bacteroidales bacterium]|nr:AAA family ATPase [Bacteroidales bacterium]
MDALQELNELTGLHSVKQQVEDLISLIDVNKERAIRGLKESQVSHHMAFLGAPGTGKTTVARLVGRIFKDLGILSSGHLIEADREKLVGQYIGHTEYKTTELINQALGGVLFIDEAYSLFKEDSPRDFGNEALSTLIKRMEDDRSNFIVIFAGYGDETKQMIQSNPGLKSRIALHIYFPDYTPE